MHGRTGAVLSDSASDERESREDNCQKGPETKLRKEQWRIRVESENMEQILLDEVNYILHWFSYVAIL